MKVKLGDIAVLINGDRGKNYPSQNDIVPNGDIPFVNAGHLDGRTICFDEMNYISREKYDRLNSGRFIEGDILYCLRGSLGKKAAVNEGVFGAIASSLVIIRPNREMIDTNYLMFALDSPSIQEQLKRANNGSSQPNLSAASVRAYDIDLPSKENQIQIVERLSMVRAIIDSRQKEIKCLDYLIKARFVEMFGDLEKNPYGWNKVGMSTVVDGKASNGYFAKREEYVKDGNVGILGVAYVVNRMYSQAIDLPRTNATAQDIKKYGVKYGDMLFCRSSLVAAGIGKASIVPQNIPDNTLFECHVIRIPLDLKKCVPEYMQVLSTTEFFRKQMIAQSKTATMTTIGQDGILRASIVLPPIEKQRDFYTFVKQIDKSKAVIQKSLDEAQLLFDSLMQQYFG